MTSRPHPPEAGPRAATSTWRDPLTALFVMAWIGGVLLLAEQRGLDDLEWGRQIVLGGATWAVLAALMRRETSLVRAQTLVVVVLATMVEYTFSPLLEAYTYRIGTVPLFVPPGHGLVYLAALALGRSALLQRRQGVWLAGTVVVGGAWTTWGLLGVAGRPHDVLGAFWFACLLGFLVFGRSRMLYVGAFVVVGYLEIVGTRLGTWAWAPTDPVLHVIGSGNPPSGVAGGYGWFDLWALVLAPRLLVLGRAVRLRAGTKRLSGATSRRSAAGGQRGQHGVVEQTVGGDGVGAERAVGAVE